jgi:peptide deformylase
MIVPIIQYPDQRLRERCTLVDPKDIETDAFQARCHDLCETLADAAGLGLAAPQIGWMVRVIALADSKHLLQSRENVPVRIIANPTAYARDDTRCTALEGCLSFAVGRVNEKRERLCNVTVRGLSCSGDGVTEWEFEALDGFCAQHEIDHLEGVTMIDGMGRMQRRMFLRQCEKAKGRRR